MTQPVKEYHKNIIDRLHSAYRKKNLLYIVDRSILSLTVAILFLIFAVLLEMVFHFSSETRTVLFLIAFTFIAVTIVYFVFIPLSKMFLAEKKKNLYQTAKDVGENNLNISDKLLNALQLVTSNENIYSEELVNASFKSVYEESSNINFPKHIRTGF